MSVRVMTLVWALELPDSEKLVLLALADSANDEGHCWPSMKSLVRKCSKSDRTIQGAIQRLVDAGHLTRREVAGKGCNYTVHPRNIFTPEAASPRSDYGTPPKPVRATPEAASDKPSKNHQEPSLQPRKRGDGAKSLIPADWKPPAVADLPPRARALAEQWTDASYQTEAEAFLCYWRSERKMKGDWNDTWANRIVARNSAVLRDQKFGNAAPELAREPTPDQQLAFLKNGLPHWEATNPAAAEDARRRIAEMERSRRPQAIGSIVKAIERRVA